MILTLQILRFATARHTLNNDHAPSDDTPPDVPLTREDLTALFANDLGYHRFQ